MYSTRQQELTYIIKQDIANLNKQIASLQSYVKQRSAQGGSKSPEAKQVDEHNHNVVMMLQSKLADTSMAFKDVLEIRTQVRSFQLSYINAIILRFTEHERVEGPNGTVHAFDVRGRDSSSFQYVYPTLHASSSYNESQIHFSLAANDQTPWATGRAWRRHASIQKGRVAHPLRATATS